jgi:hypothetical protein
MELISATYKHTRQRFLRLTLDKTVALIHTLEMPAGVYGILPAGSTVDDAIKQLTKGEQRK